MKTRLTAKIKEHNFLLNFLVYILFIFYFMKKSCFVTKCVSA